MIGMTLGHYRVLQELGRGGMGEVYAADDLVLNRKVALKCLPDAFTGDSERLARFEREVKLSASLNHPMEGDRRPMPLFPPTGFNEADGYFSPDMRWVAYQSSKSGRNEIYVRGFSKAAGAASETGGKWKVSQSGAVLLRSGWKSDGRGCYSRP
jgi:serine/threonine protein kinase